MVQFSYSSNICFLGKRGECNEPFIQTKPLVSAVLLSSWNQGESHQKLRSLIEKLIHKNCSYFVCAGLNAESLHDYIDDIIVGLSIKNDLVQNKGIMTTWHDEDTSDEVADFFLNSTGIENGVLLALLDSEEIGDKKIEKSLLNLIRN